MTRQEIDTLVKDKALPDACANPDVTETHISWVILCDQYVYKIKQPVRYSFLDFSTREKRKHYCERELELNSRFSSEVYLEVLPVVHADGKLKIGGSGGEVIDYAVHMRRLDNTKEMDLLLAADQVTSADIHRLAEVIGAFHLNTEITKDVDVFAIHGKISALEHERKYLSAHLGAEAGRVIDRNMASSLRFLEQHGNLLKSRLDEGLFRDGHGDLHSHNIFLLPEPVLFDCLEFDDSYRRIDVLNDIAFLCMDLEAYGRSDLSLEFVEAYNTILPAVRNKEEENLFNYYRSYRANVLAKVNSLRAQNTADGQKRNTALKDADKYLRLMERYDSALW